MTQTEIPHPFLLVNDPRFASIFAYCQREIERVQREVTARDLRKMCVMRFFNADGVETHRRPATDTEIAGPDVFVEAKNVAYANGFRAMVARAKHLRRFYGLNNRYAPH